MSIVLIPALISLFFKLFVLAYAARGGRVSVLFLSLIIVFGIHNTVEATGYIQFLIGKPEETVAITFKLYYIATVYLLLYIILHALKVSKIEKALITSSLVITANLLCIGILFTDSIIEGHRIISYTMTAVKGPYYWAFSAYVISILSLSLISLIYGKQRAPTQLDATRCKYSLLALLPIFSVFLLVIILKTLKITINAAGLPQI